MFLEMHARLGESAEKKCMQCLYVVETGGGGGGGVGGAGRGQ